MLHTTNYCVTIAVLLKNCAAGPFRDCGKKKQKDRKKRNTDIDTFAEESR